MVRFRFSGLRLRLFSLVVIALLPALGIVLYDGWQNRELARREAQEDALQLARLAAQRHDELIERAFLLATTLSQLPPVLSQNPPLCDNVLGDVLADYEAYSGIFVVLPKGDVLCSAPPSAAPINITDRDYFWEVMERREPMMGPFLVGRITGVPALPIIYPVVDESGAVQRIVIIGLDLTWLDRFNQEQMEEGYTLLVFDQRSTILSNYPNGADLIGQTTGAPIVEHVLAHPQEGTAEAEGIDGTYKLFGYAPLSHRSENRGYLAVGVPLEVADRPVNRSLLLNLTAILLIVLGGSLALLLSELVITRRVNRLVTTAEALAAGDLSARTGTEKVRGELDHLAQKLDEMAGSLQKQVAQRREAERRLRLLAHRLATAQEEERRSLAAELHDNAGQWLTALLINLQVFHRQLPSEMAEQREQVEELIHLTETLGEDLRSLAHRLRPPALDRMGLDAALEKLCEDFSRHTQLPVHYTGVDLPPIPNSTSTACYRFVQEALNNAAKHAQAEQITVVLSHGEDQFTVQVADDGLGFESAEGDGMGLISMQERIEGVGGTLEIESGPGSGTQLTARVPF